MIPIQNRVFRAAAVLALSASPSLCAAAETTARHLRLKNATVDWGSADEQSRRQYIVVDPDGRRLVRQPDKNDIKQFGEMEFTWDVPATIGADENVAVSFGGRNVKVPSWGSGMDIKLYLGNGLDSDRGQRVDQFVGRGSDMNLYEGRQKVTIRTRGLGSMAPGTDVTLGYGFYHVGITYHYEVVSGPAPGKPTGLLGAWRWSTGTTVTLHADGKFETGDGQSGTWDAVDRAGRGLRLFWRGGEIEFLVLAADGRSLEGKNVAGRLVSATRDKDAPGAAESISR